MKVAELKRLSELANKCRTENEQPELSSMLRDLDSSLEDIIESKALEEKDLNAKMNTANYDKTYVEVHDGTEFVFYIYWDDNGNLIHIEEY